jgi:hypothetical protein
MKKACCTFGLLAQPQHACAIYYVWAVSFAGSATASDTVHLNILRNAAFIAQQACMLASSQPCVILLKNWHQVNRSGCTIHIDRPELLLMNKTTRELDSLHFSVPMMGIALTMTCITSSCRVSTTVCCIHKHYISTHYTRAALNLSLSAG